MIGLIAHLRPFPKQPLYDWIVLWCFWSSPSCVGDRNDCTSSLVQCFKCRMFNDPSRGFPIWKPWGVVWGRCRRTCINVLSQENADIWSETIFLDKIFGSGSKPKTGQ
jgi:hypothetical protein